MTLSKFNSSLNSLLNWLGVVAQIPNTQTFSLDLALVCPLVYLLALSFSFLNLRNG